MSEERVAYQVTQRPTSHFQDMHFPDGWIAFRYDAKRGIIEIQRRGQKHYFDLASVPTEPMDKSE